MLMMFPSVAFQLSVLRRIKGARCCWITTRAGVLICAMILALWALSPFPASQFYWRGEWSLLP